MPLCVQLCSYFIFWKSLLLEMRSVHFYYNYYVFLRQRKVTPNIDLISVILPLAHFEFYKLIKTKQWIFIFVKSFLLLPHFFHICLKPLRLYCTSGKLWIIYKIENTLADFFFVFSVFVRSKKDPAARSKLQGNTCSVLKAAVFRCRHLAPTFTLEM